MPFKETCPVEERIALFVEYETGVFTIAELCRGMASAGRRFTCGSAAGRVERRAGTRAGAMRWRAVRTRRMA